MSQAAQTPVKRGRRKVSSPEKSNHFGRCLVRCTRAYQISCLSYFCFLRYLIGSRLTYQTALCTFFSCDVFGHSEREIISFLLLREDMSKTLQSIIVNTIVTAYKSRAFLSNFAGSMGKLVSRLPSFKKSTVGMPRTFFYKMAAMFSPKGFGFSRVIIVSVAFMSLFLNVYNHIIWIFKTEPSS